MTETLNHDNKLTEHIKGRIIFLMKIVECSVQL